MKFHLHHVDSAVMSIWCIHSAESIKKIVRPASTWFLEIDFVREVGVCVRPRGYKLHSRDIE